jgi:hypothetical protein
VEETLRTKVSDIKSFILSGIDEAIESVHYLPAGHLAFSNLVLAGIKHPHNLQVKGTL